METIKVNMTPCKDVQTIHASQNDSEAREWGFELHNNGDVIDSSEISDQLVFKAYKGGTEQILPENGSVPTTSPIIADIKYPQGLLTDQEFTYRQSPTESDGNAKIQAIYGNTLKWNQLVETVYTPSSAFNGITRTALGNGGVRVSGTATATDSYTIATQIRNVVGHKVLIDTGCELPSGSRIFYSTEDRQRSVIVTVPSSGYITIAIRINSNITIDVNAYPQVFDLTQMFGATKAEEIYAMEQAQSGSGIAYFRSLYPLSYYQYDSGSLLPFRGEGLKTVGKNLLKTNDSLSWTPSLTKNEDGSIHVQGSRTSDGVYVLGNITLLANKTYVIKKTGNVDCYIQLRYDGQTLASVGRNDVEYTPTQNIECTIRLFARANVDYDFTIYPQIEFGSTSSDYESYTSSTLSLPISAYFPSGMKDVPDYTNGGKIYDEMTSNKADTRVGSVDLGTLNWTKNTNYDTVRFVSDSNSIPLAKLPPANTSVANIKARYTSFATNNLITTTENGIALSNVGSISVRDSAYTSGTAEAFKSAMSGQYLYYELATPTETSFTTASLVTENAEIPLSNEDGTLIGKCTEELSAEPGFHDAKIKLADGDGECYSNKIQLHVERSPQ